MGSIATKPPMSWSIPLWWPRRARRSSPTPPWTRWCASCFPGHGDTPNIPEAEVLSGTAIASSEDVEAAASLIADRCVAVWENASDFADAAPSVPAILIKGGHGVDEPDAADDYLRMADGESVWLRGTRIANDNTHGTGCSLSSAIALRPGPGLFRGRGRARRQGLRGRRPRGGLNLGRGSGPLDHMWQYGAPMPC